MEAAKALGVVVVVVLALAVAASASVVIISSKSHIQLTINETDSLVSNCLASETYQASALAIFTVCSLATTGSNTSNDELSQTHSNAQSTSL